MTHSFKQDWSPRAFFPLGKERHQLPVMKVMMVIAGSGTEIRQLL